MGSYSASPHSQLELHAFLRLPSGDIVVVSLQIKKYITDHCIFWRLDMSLFIQCSHAEWDPFISYAVIGMLPVRKWCEVCRFIIDLDFLPVFDNFCAWLHSVTLCHKHCTKALDYLSYNFSYTVYYLLSIIYSIRLDYITNQLIDSPLGPRMMICEKWN